MRRLIAGAAMLVVGMASWSAQAGTVPLGLVSVEPAAWTPNVLDGAVEAIAVVGDVVVVGGDFTTVADPATGTRYRRPNLFMFTLGTGRLSEAVPAVDGPVTALAAAPGGGVHVAGRFGRVNDQPSTGLVELDVPSGRIVDGFTAGVGKGQVRSLAASGPWLYVGGSFTAVGGHQRTGLARLDAATGAVDTGFDLQLARADKGTVKVEAVAVTADGARLAAVGAFDTAGGLRRVQLVVASLTDPAPRVADWFTDAYTGQCKTLYDSYLRGVDFAPDGSWLAVAATGSTSGPRLMCDSAARFDLAGAGKHLPVWVNRTGGNTLWSVAATDAAVYVGGHQQWMDNPQGHKNAGPGAVNQPGIAAFDPASGAALPWNPTHSRGIGVGVLVICRAGLLVGSDTDQLGWQYHGRIGLLPAP